MNKARDNCAFSLIPARIGNSVGGSVNGHSYGLSELEMIRYWLIVAPGISSMP